MRLAWWKTSSKSSKCPVIVRRYDVVLPILAVAFVGVLKVGPGEARNRPHPLASIDRPDRDALHDTDPNVAVGHQ